MDKGRRDTENGINRDERHPKKEVEILAVNDRDLRVKKTGSEQKVRGYQKADGSLVESLPIR